MSETYMINSEKKDAKIPAITTWFAFFFPNISDIKSVTKKVNGYGKIPTDISNVCIPKKSHEKNFWKIRFDTTNEVINSAAKVRYNLYANNFFVVFINLSILLKYKIIVRLKFSTFVIQRIIY